jgi:hypothetical protein
MRNIDTRRVGSFLDIDRCREDAERSGQCKSSCDLHGGKSLVLRTDDGAPLVGRLLYDPTGRTVWHSKRSAVGVRMLQESV